MGGLLAIPMAIAGLAGAGASGASAASSGLGIGAGLGGGLGAGAGATGSMLSSLAGPGAAMSSIPFIGNTVGEKFLTGMNQGVRIGDLMGGGKEKEEQQQLQQPPPLPPIPQIEAPPRQLLPTNVIPTANEFLQALLRRRV